MPNIGFSQKYAAIRERFFRDFYYDGLVADAIEGDWIKFADQTLYMGQALTFLATEAGIKRRIGEDTRSTVQTINQILDAIDELDNAAEPMFGSAPAINGFVARDNISGYNDPRLSKRWARVASDGQNPNNVSPSGDQIFGLMSGLWFVVRYADDTPTIARAKELSNRLFGYAKRCHFYLTRPDDVRITDPKEVPVERGADMRWLSSLLHGMNKNVTGQDCFHDCRIEIGPIQIGLQAVATFWDHVGKDAAQLIKTELDIPGIGKRRLTFVAHLILMAIAPSDIWSKEEFEKAAVGVNHHLAVLAYSLAHNTTPSHFGYSDIEDIMNRCPDDGPRGDLPTDTGWQRDNRWIRCSEIHLPQEDARRYFGVDFLMLHNLAALTFHSNE